ncbi:MAG: hypothetical protein WAW85_07365 [Gordonia sp. (in: high G+C Gram-positive bacteria)]|uniref:hypothetical protein n=1 Tax=Gordonia sp. (in: high G+C Gram-positive bacteria) TaxID=84139 RepID=UPI003BB6F3A7
MSEQNDTISRATVLTAVGASAVVTALILSIGALGLWLSGAGVTGQSAAPSTVVNLGAAHVSAPVAQAPVAQAPVLQAPALSEPAVAVPSTAGEAAPVEPGTSTTSSTTTTQRRSPTSIREAKQADLQVPAERPTAVDLEWQFAAFWNPRIAIGPKLAVTYNGQSAAVRKPLEQVLASSQTYDFFSMRGSATGPPRINGERMSITFRGTMAGFPVQQTNYYYIRDGGLWKFDWKRICADMQCANNPNFGY